MKMKTIILSALLMAVAGTAQAYRAGALNEALSGVGFQAPWMTDHTYADAEKGDIVYNTSEDIFYGKTTSGWTPFDAANSNSLWYVDVSMYGDNTVLDTTSVGTYKGEDNANLTLSMNLDSDTAEIACEDGVSSSGTTCGTDDENLGIAFTIPRTGVYRVCVQGGHGIGTGSPAATTTTFQLVETTNSSHTPTNSGSAKVHTGSYSNFVNVHPLSLCSNFKFTSTGEKTIRLFYIQSVTGTVSSNLILSNLGLNWTVNELK